MSRKTSVDEDFYNVLYSVSSLYFLYIITHTCQPHINSGCGKREAHENRSMVIPEKGAPVPRTTLSITDPLPADSRQ